MKKGLRVFDMRMITQFALRLGLVSMILSQAYAAMAMAHEAGRNDYLSCKGRKLEVFIIKQLEYNYILNKQMPHYYMSIFRTHGFFKTSLIDGFEMVPSSNMMKWESESGPLAATLEFVGRDFRHATIAADVGKYPDVIRDNLTCEK